MKEEVLDLCCTDLPFDSSRDCNQSSNNIGDKRCAQGAITRQSRDLTSHCETRRRSLQIFILWVAALPVVGLWVGCGAWNGVAGTVAATANPQVALYTVTPQAQANVTIVFGPSTSYGLQTWTQPTPPGGGPVSIYVAGMRANTTYHMQAVVQYADGSTFKDLDHTFTTGSYGPEFVPSVTTTTAPGKTPQPGIEIVNPVESGAPITAFDLEGNLIWAYDDTSLALNNATWLAPKLLPNGHFIAMVALASQEVLTGPSPAGTPNLVREFDLAGNTIKEISMPQLNAALAVAGFNVTLQVFSHDVTVLPNGHWLVLSNTIKQVVLNGQSAPTAVLGDVIVDLDSNLNPVWVWNEFDHLDVNRQPWMFPDWTHSNAVIYSPDDGNLLVSLRHQNWILKVAYFNGTGTGDILWHLGEGGDFKLLGGTDPTDWSYAQHGISFTTPNTTGTFGLAVMDNGDDRIFPGGVAETCGVNGAPACFSTVQVFQINESAMTATLQFHQILPGTLYSFFGGNALMLSNGDIEYDLCGLSPQGSQVSEVTNEANPQPVWTMLLNNNFAYRAYRLPSLYPGVQW